MQTVRDLYILTVILFIKGIGSNSNVKPEVSSPKYSDLDVCSDKVHTVLNENWREIGSKESNNCDQKLKEGWYRFLINGKTAQLPSLCIKNKACGTVIPLRLDLHDQQLPTVNHSISVSVCGSYTILRKWDCCVLRQPAVVHNCGMFYVYRLSPPDRCDVGYCVVSEENQMKMHVFTAKTGEPSSELPNPTYPTSTTTYIPSTAKDNRCSSNERQCPNGCVPLSQSCPMTLDLNTLRRRIVHTFDTIRQTHYFTHKTTTRKIPTATTSIETSSEQVTTTYQSQSLPERTTPSADITSSVFTTLITAMTTKEDNRANIKETDQTTINNTSHTVDNTASTSENLNMSTFSVYDLKTQRTLDLSTLSQPTTTMSESRETTSKTAHNSGFHENQNEQPVFEESYCGVTLAFKFEASYLQNVNFTAFRKKLQVIFASLLNIYYVDNYGVYIEGIFSWKTRYHRETFKTYTSSHVHFGRGIHNQSNYYITVFAEDIFNTVLYLPDKVLSTLLQNSTVVHYIQEEIKEFHATFLNKTSNNTEMTSREKPSTPYTPLLYTNFGLCIAVFLPVSIFVVCALIGVLKIKSKNRCMNLRRKSGQYYVKWEKALKRDVCKGIGYTENPMKDKDIIKGENSVKQNLISPKDKDSTEEDDNVANDKRGKKLADDSSWVLPTKEFYNPSVVQGLHTKL